MQDAPPSNSANIAYGGMRGRAVKMVKGQPTWKPSTADIAYFK